jgi:hypothetical protein
MSLRAQIPLPVATQTLHAAAIATHRRNPACESVENAALHTIQGALHPGLTLTGMYNVLEKLRLDATLTEKVKILHEQGLVPVSRNCTTDSTPPCSTPSAQGSALQLSA